MVKDSTACCSSRSAVTGQLQPSSAHVNMQQAESAPSFKLAYINAAVLDGTITSYRCMPSFHLTDFNVTGCSKYLFVETAAE